MSTVEDWDAEGRRGFRLDFVGVQWWLVTAALYAAEHQLTDRPAHHEPDLPVPASR